VTIKDCGSVILVQGTVQVTGLEPNLHTSTLHLNTHYSLEEAVDKSRPVDKYAEIGEIIKISITDYDVQNVR
jgi:hypothetical protein